MTPFLIDVDTGIDDAFGLLFALGRPDIKLTGVSTVAGNVGLERATRNTRAVLALAGRSDIPVFPGCAAPLVKVAADASDIHGASGLGHAELSESTRRRPRRPMRSTRFAPRPAPTRANSCWSRPDRSPTSPPH